MFLFLYRYSFTKIIYIDIFIFRKADLKKKEEIKKKEEQKKKEDLKRKEEAKKQDQKKKDEEQRKKQDNSKSSAVPIVTEPQKVMLHLYNYHSLGWIHRS